MGENVQWRFGIAGNITKSHLDENGEVRYGTKAFTSGTKVYLCGKNWDRNKDGVCAIGINRFGRMVMEYVPVEYIENVRTQRIYHPAVLDIINSEEVMEGFECWKRTSADRKEAKQFVKDWLARM